MKREERSGRGKKQANGRKATTRRKDEGGMRASSGTAEETTRGRTRSATRHEERGRRTGQEYREIQRASESKAPPAAKKPAKGGGKEKPVQAGEREQPENPMPAQHVAKPGLEAELELKPRYEAPDYEGSNKLRDMVAIITGGDSGIGRAVAVLYAREGADVAIVYLPDEQVDAEETRDAVQGEGRECLLVPGDVSDAAFCEEVVERTLQEFGKLDILVNNAAFQQHADSIDAIDVAQLERTFRTNIFGYFNMAKAALPHLKEGSSVINTSSVTATKGSKHLLDYSSTKGAIDAFTRSLAQSVLERGIRVNAVAPGPVWTPLNPADRDGEQVKDFGKHTGMKRPAQPEEISPIYVFLAAPVCASYITGEVIPVVGGQGG